MKTSTATPTRTGTLQATQIGAPWVTRVPAIVASTPIRAPIETSIWPVMITTAMPMAATAI